MEFIARHNISSGPKGKRQTIEAGKKFNPKDYPDITGPEWEAMAKNGNIYPPDDLSYASPTVMQRAAPVAEEPRNDPADDDDDDDDEPERPARSRRSRTRRENDDDDL